MASASSVLLREAAQFHQRGALADAASACLSAGPAEGSAAISSADAAERRTLGGVAAPETSVLNTRTLSASRQYPSADAQNS